MKHLFVVFFALCVSFAHGQTTTTSNNLLFLGTTSGSARIYGIATALAQGTTGVTVSGFDYGYKYNLGSSYTQCTATNQDGSCSWWMTFSPRADVNIQIRNNDNGLIYNQTHTHTGQNIIGGQNDIQYRFSDPRNITSLSTFRMGVGIQGAASVYEPYSKVIYSVDPCVANPLSSSSCPGYAQAYHDQQCAANPLYAVTCPGYQTAYFNQQCTASALYNSACPGYAQALFIQTCNTNPLSDATCPGYQQAYFNQQCTANQLYSSGCPGYAAAYKTQQCTANPLYATDCPGYAQAYLNAQCIIDSLYSRLCSGYATAYAIKYLVPLDSTTSSAVNSSLSTTAAVKAMDPVSVNTNGTVSNIPSATGNSTVDNVISTPSTTSVTSPTSITSVINAPPPPPGSASQASAPPPAAVQQERAAENKKTEGAVASVERKAGGDREAAKKEATAQAKELANSMSRAATLEAQVASQGLVVGLMNFVPGFSAYQNAIVPDVLGNQVARQYSKPTVDNRSAQRQLSGGNELRWREMVDSQYNRGK
jgi:hypothetical protein